MKTYYRGVALSILLFLLSGVLSAQPISTYDDESLREITIPDIISNFENALNVISFSGSEPLDYKIIKSRLLNDEETPRTFYSPSIIIENDLHFDDWSNTLKEDQEINTYLDNFNLLYGKTSDPTVTFTIIQVSKLKKREYFYYNVLYESVFANKDVDGNRYVPTRRIAEIRLDYDTAWNAFINGIRFTDSNFDINDTQYVFFDFTLEADRSTDFKLMKLAQKREQQLAQHMRFSQLLAEGDNYYLTENYLKALDVYKRALPLEPFNEEVRAKISKTENTIDQLKKKKKQEEELAIRKDAMRLLVKKAFYDHDFKVYKLYYDSLTVYYGFEQDPELQQMNQKTLTVIPFISRMAILESQSDYEDAGDYASKIIKANKKVSVNQDSLLLSEALFWSAREQLLLDSTETDDVGEYCEKALLYSGNRHMPAKKLLIKSKLSSKRNQLEALEIATSMVNYDPKNPDLRAIRARVYNQLKDPENALRDYQVAIDLKTKDSLVFTEKANIELSLHKPTNSVFTTATGLSQFPCNQELYYIRIIAQEEMGLMASAGKDYQKALQCGLSGYRKDVITTKGRNYFDMGLSFFDANQIDSAYSYFTKSYELTQNLDALYYRGFTNLKLNRLDPALSDLNKVVATDSLNNHAYHMRGLIKAAAGNHESAVNDFKKQVAILPDYWKSYAAAGYSYLKLKKYQLAAEEYKKANQIRYTDTSAAQHVYALYLDNNYVEAIKVAENYINDNDNDNPKLIKYKGISAFQIKLYKTAEDELKNALELEPNDSEAAIFLSKNYLSMGEPGKGLKAAEIATTNCNSCADALTLEGISYIAQQKTGNCLAGIYKIQDAIKKSKSAASSTNYAWIAYGYLLIGSENSKYEQNMKNAEDINSDDPMVLFTKACALSYDLSKKKDVILLIEEACKRGFTSKYLIDHDPGLKKIKSDNDFKNVLLRYR